MTKLFFFYILLLFSSCSIKNEKAEPLSGEYLRLIKKFPDKMVFHFPKKITYPANFTHYSTTEYTYSGITLRQSYVQSQIDSIIDSMDSMAIQRYNANDTCLLIVNRFYREKKYGVRNTYESSLSRPVYCGNDRCSDGGPKGGVLLNKINSIAESKWMQFGIF